MELVAEARSSGFMIRAFLAAAAGQSAMGASAWMQPLLFHYLSAERGFGATSTGFAMTAETGSMALAALVLARFVGRRHAQTAAMSGMLLAAAASLITLYAASYITLVLSRIVVGAGVGATIMVANIVAANSTDPDKTFAQLGFVNLLSGAVIVGGMPLLKGVMPSATPYTNILFNILFFIPFMALMPKLDTFDRWRDVGTDTSDLPTEIPLVQLRTGLLALSTSLIIVSSGVIWTLYSVIGLGTGLSETAVNSSIALSIFTSVIGLGLPAVLGSSMGRVIPVCAAMILTMIAIVVLMTHPTVLEFKITVCVNVGCMYFLMPYLSGAAAAIDGGGKAAAYIGGCILLSNAISPFVGGLAVGTLNTAYVGYAEAALSAIAAILFIYVDRAGRGLEMASFEPVPVTGK